jgi:hypothetical protein
LRGTTPGRASFVGSSALWAGLVAGLFVGAASPEDDRQDDSALLASAIGLNVGAVAGALAAGPVSPSIARVRFLDLGGIGGGLLFGGLYLAAADKDIESRGLMGATALGSALGIGVAWYATSGMPADRIERSDRVSRPAMASIAPARGGAMLSFGGEF